MKTLVLAIMMAFAVTAVYAGDYEAEIQSAFQKAKTASYPASTFTRPMAWSVGQWVLIGLTDDDGEKSLQRMAIVNHDGEWWTIEMKSINEDDVIYMQMVLKGLDKITSPENMDELEFKKIRMKTNDDDPIEIEGFMLSMAKGVYKDGLKGWVTQSMTLKNGPALTVPAGTFAGTSVAHTTVHVLGKEVESDCWMSASVPITGMVKSTSTDGYTQVLLDFGLDGAKPSF